MYVCAMVLTSVQCNLCSRTKLSVEGSVSETHKIQATGNLIRRRDASTHTSCDSRELKDRSLIPRQVTLDAYVVFSVASSRVGSSRLDFVVALRWHEHRPIRLVCASLCLRKGLLPCDTQVHDSLSPPQHWIGVKAIGAKSERVPVRSIL